MNIKLTNCKWTIESDGIHIINSMANKQLFLTYPEAALWQLLANGHSLEKTAELFSYIINDKLENSNKMILSIINNWENIGMVEVSEKC